MNLKGNKSRIVDSEQKIKDASKNYLEELLMLGIPATDILRELDQYLPDTVAKEFVDHYKTIYEITDAQVINAPYFTEAMIAAQKERIDKYKSNLQLLVSEEGIRPADVVIAIDDFLTDYDRLRLVQEVKEKLDVSGDFRSLHGVAREAGYPQVLEVLGTVEVPDIVLEQAITDVLMSSQQIKDAIDGIQDPGNLNERAEQVEKYTADISKMAEDGIADPMEIIACIDEICEDKVDGLATKISEETDNPDSLDSTLAAYIEHQGIDPMEALRIANGFLPEEDRLVLVDSILE